MNTGAAAARRLVLIFVVVFFWCASASAKTNLVLILSDNHGAWTLGCYGNEEIRTPNIDRLANEGLKYVRAYCANPVCSPSRATWLTGLMPSQHGVHNYLPADNQLSPSGSNACVIHEFSTLPKIMARAGYTCGLAGKWHLGGSLQPQEGFGYWFTKPSGHTTTFYGDQAIWQEKIYRETNYMTDVIAEHAVDFIEKNQAKPFFLYVAFNAPYGLGAVVQQPHTNRHTAYYADKPMNSFPRAKVNPALKTQRVSVNNVESMRSYAAAVSGLDDGVGRIMEALRRLNLETNTLVVFSADQGLSGGHNGYWGIGDHARPVNIHDSVARIPLVFRQRGKIQPHDSSASMVSNYDFLPTILAYLNLTNQMPKSPPLPGKSFAAELAGGLKRSVDREIFYEYENTRVVQNVFYKLVLRSPNGPNELYSIADDPNEERNQFDHDKFHSVRGHMTGQLNDFFAKYAEPKYDLWRSGTSKVKRATNAGGE